MPERGGDSKNRDRGATLRFVVAVLIVALIVLWFRSGKPTTVPSTPASTAADKAPEDR
jgi:hypothetical protein